MKAIADEVGSLTILLARARRTSRRGAAARLGLQQSRRETAAASQARDDLLEQRATARAYTASALAGGGPGGNGDLSQDRGHWGWLRAFGRESRPAQTAATHLEPAAGEPAPVASASVPGPAADPPEASQP